jgi:hypothetical protein
MRKGWLLFGIILVVGIISITISADGQDEPEPEPVSEGETFEAGYSIPQSVILIIGTLVAGSIFFFLFIMKIDLIGKKFLKWTWILNSASFYLANFYSYMWDITDCPVCHSYELPLMLSSFFFAFTILILIIGLIVTLSVVFVRTRVATKNTSEINSVGVLSSIF